MVSKTVSSGCGVGTSPMLFLMVVAWFPLCHGRVHLALFSEICNWVGCIFRSPDRELCSVLQRVTPRYMVSFQRHKDKVVKWKLFPAPNPSKDRYDLGITVTYTWRLSLLPFFFK